MIAIDTRAALQSLLVSAGLPPRQASQLAGYACGEDEAEVHDKGPPKSLQVGGQRVGFIWCLQVRQRVG